MNNRDYKMLAQNGFYHVYNRGVGKMEIFLDDQDKNYFISSLRENLFPESLAVLNGVTINGRYFRKLLPAGAFTLLTDCLMPNHFHLQIRQNTQLPVSQLMSKICSRYAKYFNKKYDRVGAVFQDQYKAVKIETDSQLLWLSAYIHQNPVVAGLVENIEDYKWSSYPDYTAQNKSSLCDTDFLIEMTGSREKYKKFVFDSLEKIKERKDLKDILLDF